MAPTPQNENAEIAYAPQPPDPSQLSGNEVVISGMSGNFPKSDNVLQFMKNLYDKNDMTEENCSTIVHRALPKRIGKIKDWDHFDAQFFRVSYWQAQFMNPATRLLLENSYSAIFDSGVNPVTQFGSKIGVFIASSLADVMMQFYSVQENLDFSILGTARSLLANRISYWLNSKAPSYQIDTHCSSLIVCLEKAYNAIKSGECDSAIVGGYNHILHPVATINLKRHGLLCSDQMKCFDKDGDGYIRSDVAGILFLQRAKDAKRIYSEVCYVKGKYIPGSDGNFLYDQDTNKIEEFLEEFYSDIKVRPEEVEYIEANGSGIGRFDIQELEVIGNFFGGEKPIKVGNVKSNMGNAESSSGICSIIKICLAYQKGTVAANLHSGTQNQDTEATNDRVKTLRDHTQLERGLYSAINNFSFSGLNYHVLLKDCYKPKIAHNETFSVPHLILVSGRQEECTNTILNSLEENSVDEEQVALLRNIFQYDIPGHMGRGYIILDCDHTKGMASLSRHLGYYPGGKRPIWFLYSGMGSQWPAMGLDLLRVPMFANSIEKCQGVLAPLGIDLFKILTDPEESIFDNVLYSFVGIAAVQIGLTDVLKAIGIVPDNIIGHSLGELGCAYADGCLSAEEMMLATYYRGLVSLQTKLVKGSMAAVGLGYKAILNLCPSTIEVACHNSAHSSTISGPADDVKEFVAELTRLGIFAREVQTANIAYHSEYVKDAGPGLLKYMKNVIKDPKLRSEKWLSTSVQRDSWDTAKYASAEYFTNNLLNPVYFEESARLIPSNAIIIEIAPHGLLQAIVKRSHPECYHVPLTSRAQKKSVLFLLNAIGKMYESGLNPKIQAIYPEVKFPVSTGTSLLSHMVQWEHSEKWKTYAYLPPRKTILQGRSISISVYEDEMKFLNDHLINDIIIIPPAAILVYVWETYAMYRNENYRDISVTFKNVTFYREMEVKREEPLQLRIEIQKGNQIFEVTGQDDILIATGKIDSVMKVVQRTSNSANVEHEIWINSEDLYKMLRSKGYSYKGDLQSIRSINSEQNKAYVEWKNDWITFIDGLFQLNVLCREHNGVSTPKFIDMISIDVQTHTNQKSFNIADKNCYLAQRNSYGDTFCGGVIIDYITFIDNQKPLYDYIITDKTNGNSSDHVNVNKLNMENSQQIKLMSDSPGNFDRLVWIEEERLDANYSVKVCFAGVSNYDCSKAAGSESIKNKYYGMDYSGIAENGEAVMGVTYKGALNKFVSPDVNLIWPVPKHWTMEDAATVPLPYLHAYYCLTVRCQLMPGYRVLVMNGAGALGQAVISVCLAMHCTVYTTVSDEQKKDFLIKMFPKLEEKNIYNLRQEALFKLEYLNSNNEGCDVVVNSTSGELRQAAMKCVGFGGIFLDTSEYDMISNQEFGMSYLWQSRNYKSVRLLSLFEYNNVEEIKLLHRRISDGIAQGIVKPLSRVIYSPERVTQAFRLLSSSGHRGRVLINMTELESSSTNLRTAPRINCQPDDVQIVVVSEVELAVEHIEYFITTGARNFVIFIKRSFLTDYIQMRIALWKRKTSNIHVMLEDENNESVYEDLFKTAIQFGNIEGVYVYTNKNTGEIMSNAVTTICLLDQASRQFDKLRYFVVVTADFYGNESEFIEIQKVCAERKFSGLHALHANIAKLNLDGLTSPYIEAVETCMGRNLDSVTIRVKLPQRLQSTYLQNLSSILGISNLSDLDQSLPLNNFKVTDIQIQELKSTVKQFANIDFPLSALKQMTIERLFSIGTQEKNKTKGVEYGMEVFYNYLCEDEYTASEPVVIMATQLSQSIEIDVQLNPEHTYVLMIPGLEGHSHIFNNLAERLKVKALTLQLVPDYDNTSVETIARDTYKYLKDRIKIKSKFYIFGYSFGVLVALELASLLEQEGSIGVVYCLDSSPDALKAQMNAYLGKLEDEELQNSIVTHFFSLLFKCDPKELIEPLTNAKDWETKLQLFIMKAKQNTTLSHEYLKHCLNSFYRRILLAVNYEPKLRLDSQLILIKGIAHSEMKVLSEDFNLSNYTNLPVKVFNIESEHTTAPYDNRIANIVNQTLDPNLQMEFEKNNNCDFYYWNEKT